MVRKKIGHKDGDRFDWYPIIEEEFIQTLADKVIAKLAFQDSPRGVTKEQRTSRDEDRRLIAQHLLSALYHSFFTVNNNETGVRSVAKLIIRCSITRSKFIFQRTCWVVRVCT
jgi:hypothetical protein